MSNGDRRKALRVQLTPAVAAALSHVPVSVADVSMTGARIQHDAPLTILPGKRFVLEFSCNGERFRMNCTVARARMEMNPETRRISYTTGVRFMEIDEFTLARLWAAVDFDRAAAGSAYAFQIIAN